jgi:hypothetical protein
LEKHKERLQIALDKLEAFSDGKLRLNGSEGNHMDFVRTWSRVPTNYRPKAKISLSNLTLSKGLMVCTGSLEKEIVDLNISN